MSAESITRFLRSKGDIGEICIRAKELVDSTEQVVPDASGFVLSLLTDRLNDTGSKWRFDAHPWNTLASVLTATDSGTRSKVFKRLKLVDIMIDVLSKGPQEVYGPMFSFLEQYASQEYVSIDEPQAISLVAAFASKLLGEPSWVRIISNLYQLHQLEVTYSRMSKKAYTKFIGSALPPIIKLQLEFPKSKPLTAVVESVLYNDKLASHFLTVVTKEKLLEKLSSIEINYLFELITNHFQRSDIKFCEQVYRQFISSDATDAESLLEILSRTNKPLSYELFSEVYKAETAKTNINWRLIGYLFALDVELAIEHGSTVMASIDKTTSLDLAPIIVEAYIKGREFSDFLTKVWPEAATKNKMWFNEEMIDIVSPKIDELSIPQLKAVIEAIKSDDLFECIVRGLNACGYQKIDQAREAVVAKVNLFEGNWRIAYLVASLYPEEIPSETIPSKDDYYYYTQFRLMELGVGLKDHTKFSGQVSKWISAKNIDFIVSRWLPMMEYLGVSSKIAEIIFKSYDTSKIQRFLAENSVIFELENLSAAIIDIVGTQHELYSEIPLQAYSKNQRRRVIDALIKQKEKSAVVALKHLLSADLGFQSSLESDFNTMLKYLGSATDETRSLVFDTCQIIWRAHIRHGNTEFITNAISKLEKSKVKKKVTPEMEAMLMILSSPVKPEGIENLRAQFVGNVFKLLDLVDLDETTTTWLLWGLILAVDVSSTKVISMIKRVGGDTKSPRIQSSLFSLVAKVYPTNVGDAIYVLTLYYSLLSVGVSGLFSALTEYIDRVDDDTFNQVVNFVGVSMVDVSETNSTVFADLIVVLATRLTKQNELSNRNFTFLLSSVIDSVSTMSSSALLVVLDAITSLLSTKAWLFDQYSLEQTLVLVTKVAYELRNCHESSTVECFIKATRVVSSILLFHRYKLSQRHHVVVATLGNLLEPLTAAGNRNTTLSESKDAGEAYARLLSNLCEVKIVGGNSDSLTSASAVVKKELRKHLPVLLVTYIWFALQHNFRQQVQQALVSGIYNIFDVLSSQELKLVSSLLDGSGKAYYKTLYGHYKDEGKWKDQ